MKTTTNNYLKKMGLKTLLICGLFMGSSLNCVGQDLSGVPIIYPYDYLVLNSDPTVDTNVNSGIKMLSQYYQWTMYNSNDAGLRFSWGSNGSYPFASAGTTKMMFDAGGRIRLYGSGGFNNNPGIWLNNTSNGGALKIIYKFESNTHRIGFSDASNNENFLAYSNWNTKDFIVPDANGKVGIGDESPTSKLTVGNAPNNGAAFNIRSYGTGNGWAGAGAFGGESANVVLGQLDNKAYIGAHNGALNAWADLIINAGSGNVGVGKSPAANTKLDVNGVVNATGFKINGQDLILGNLGSASTPWVSNGDNINYSTGKVGIGNENPNAKLSLGTTVNDNLIGLYDDPQGFYGFGIRGGELMIQSASSTTFGIRSGATYSEKIRINSEGKVGIGTANPTEKLDVNGVVNATGFKINGQPFTGASPWTTNGSNINYTTGQVEIGVDNAAAVNTLLNVHGSATFNNDLAIDPNLPTQVSINTDTKVTGAVLTVGGPTYIGDWKEAEAGINAAYLQDFYLWVKKGVVSEDFAISHSDTWEDRVFNEGYQLPTLKELKTFIEQNKHLPGIPSEQEVKEQGYSVNELNKAFLQKIEHLVLYTLQQEEKIESMEKDIKLLKAILLKKE